MAAPIPNNLTFHSRFGGPWIDRVDAPSLLSEKLERGAISKEVSDLIRKFINDGYVVIKRAVPKEITEAIRAELDNFYTSPPDGMMVDTGQQRLVPPSMKVRDGATRLLDLHAFSENARRAIAAPKTIEFLSAIFETKPKAFQSLTFWNGSQQAIHKDTAYVQVDGAPMHIAATWLALENVTAGTGELEYFVGSHRAPDFLFGGKHKWMTAAPGEHERFLASHHQDAKKYGYEKSSFLAEEGDVLVWHADLAHGGSPITQPGKTRKSLVTHFTSAEYEPPYNAKRKRVPSELNGCLFISVFKPESFGMRFRRLLKTIARA